MRYLTKPIQRDNFIPSFNHKTQIQNNNSFLFNHNKTHFSTQRSFHYLTTFLPKNRIKNNHLFPIVFHPSHTIQNNITQISTSIPNLHFGSRFINVKTEESNKTYTNNNNTVNDDNYQEDIEKLMQQNKKCPEPLCCWSCNTPLQYEDFFCNECNTVQPPLPDADFFDIMQCPRQFEIDLDKLENTFRQLQRQLHPDKFGTKSQTEQKLSQIQSAHINEAYQTLKKPNLRAQYLLKLNGEDFDEKDAPPELLMSVFELMEEVNDTDTSNDRLFELRDAVLNQIDKVSGETTEHFNNNDLENARKSTTKLNYLARVQQSLYDRLGVSDFKSDQSKQ